MSGLDYTQNTLVNNVYKQIDLNALETRKAADLEKRVISDCVHRIVDF